MNQARVVASPSHVEDLLDRIESLRSGGRLIIGVAGAPGAGKSTLADALAQALRAREVTCVVVGMDGFHLAQGELTRLGLADRKGAPDTFDAAGYVALLRRLRDQDRDSADVVYAPSYARGAVEQPIGSAVPVSGTDEVVLTEGNYLLWDNHPWRQVRDLLEETWFLRTDEATRRRRLLARHLANGKDAVLARAFTDGSDAANADLVAATADAADLLIEWH